jgi:hypothetical protein
MRKQSERFGTQIFTETVEKVRQGSQSVILEHGWNETMVSCTWAVSGRTGTEQTWLLKR